MRQVWATKAGEPQVLQLREVPAPAARNGEVRVQVEAAGVTFVDLEGRLGLRRNAPATPFVPGLEIAGTIDTVAQGVSGFREGDKVFALTAFGGYSDLVCVPYTQVFKRLDWMDAKDGAALPASYITAYIALVVLGSLRPGNQVLIHNAGGGVGMAALDICRIFGAVTYGTASTMKHEFLQQQGLDHAIDYRRVDYVQQISESLGNRGMDIILDTLGGRHWPRNYRLLAPTGRLIHLGTSSVVSGKRLSRLRLWRSAIMMPFYTALSLMRDNKAVAGFSLTRLLDQGEVLRPWMEQIIAWYDEALFRPTIAKTFPLNKAVEAHEYLQGRHNIGKVLLTL